VLPLAREVPGRRHNCKADEIRANSLAVVDLNGVPPHKTPPICCLPATSTKTWSRRY